MRAVAPQITLAHSYLPNRIGLASGVTLGLTLSPRGLVSPRTRCARRCHDHSHNPLVIAFAASFLLRERTEFAPASAIPVTANH